LGGPGGGLKPPRGLFQAALEAIYEMASTEKLGFL
jgi:hypothetical protein